MAYVTLAYCPCHIGRHDQCINIGKGDNTWCTCQHKPAFNYLDQEQCKHLRLTEADKDCPSCGLSAEVIKERGAIGREITQASSS